MGKRLKDIRAAQLDDLKTGIFPAAYRVDLLNDSFIPAESWYFETRKEAAAKAMELEKITPPGFIRKYAVFDF